VMHIACIFPGCCHGYPAQWGIYNNKLDTICFPIQPIESCCDLIISATLTILLIKKRQQEKLFWWQLLLFGGARFLVEFFRDNTKIWMGMSEFSFYALAAAMVGLLALILCKCKQKEELING